jgi:glycosyltransferase involved in cell wall biosynthesis
VKLLELASSSTWNGKVTFTGFLSPERAAILLAAADAVILPFRNGGGNWNTSIHSAILNGAFVITTSLERTGYDKTNNVFYAKPDAVTDMRAALQAHETRAEDFDSRDRPLVDEWASISEKHLTIYRDLLGRRAKPERLSSLP